MLIISNVFLKHDFDFSNCREICARILNADVSDITAARLYRRSVDARKKSDVKFCCSFAVEIKDEQRYINGKDITLFKKREYTFCEEKIKTDKRTVIAGFGPAGIFAALTLAKRGLRPIVLERGKPVDERKKDVAEFLSNGNLNTESNVLFGEGGAGTFSDGKLNTGIKDERCRAVIKTFFDHGANEDILFEAKPHIGTDMLPNIIKSIREEIVKLGGEVLFSHKLTKINTKQNKIYSVTAETLHGTKEIPCDFLILAVGHSARETFITLNEMGVQMCAKPFSVGARIEHPQLLINRAQLGQSSKFREFTPADYKLFTHLKDGRGVYTFCMCPGGSVINSSSEIGGIVTNGMSNNARSGKNANSALLVGVDTSDFGNGVLDGMYFQQRLEQKAYSLSGGYAPPAMRVGDFLKTAEKSRFTVNPTADVHFADLYELFPEYITSAMREGIKIFAAKLNGFDDPAAILTAPETRSSSPVKIFRDTRFESSVAGLVPSGEGAGHAGGIVSAAVDGIRCAESIIERII